MRGRCRPFAVCGDRPLQGTDARVVCGIQIVAMHVGRLHAGRDGRGAHVRPRAMRDFGDTLKRRGSGKHISSVSRGICCGDRMITVKVPRSCCLDPGARSQLYLCVDERTGASRKEPVSSVVLLRTWPDSLKALAPLMSASANFPPIKNGRLPSSISFASSPGSCFTRSRKNDLDIFRNRVSIW